MTATMTAAGHGDKQAADNTTAGNDAAPSTEDLMMQKEQKRASGERYIDCMEPTGRSGYRLDTRKTHSTDVTFE